MAAVIGNRDISLGVMGGTLITAACYSGGDVFAPSPYDKATTRYLKETYGAYWQAIRQFGFSHKSLIPFINEDNDLIVSLVGVGKVRGITANGTYAYADTLISRTEGTYVLCNASILRTANENFLYGSMLTGSPYNRNYVKQNSNGTLQIGHGDVCPNSTNTLVANHIYNIECLVSKTSAYLTFDDTTVTSSGNRNISSNTIKIFSTDYAINRYPSTWVVWGAMDFYEVDKVTKIATFVPFKRNGQMELLDIVTGTLATRVGTFTELIE